MKFFYLLFFVVSVIGISSSFKLFLRTSPSVFSSHYKLAPDAEVTFAEVELVNNRNLYLRSDIIHPWNTEFGVGYKYEVNGIIYLGKFYKERTGVTDYQNASQFYPIGKKLTVYYDERDPSKSFEKSSENYYFINSLIMILAFSFVCAWSAYNLFSSRRVINFVE